MLKLHVVLVPLRCNSRLFGNVWLRIIFSAELTWRFNLIWVSSLQTSYLNDPAAHPIVHSALLCQESVTSSEGHGFAFLWCCWAYTLNVLFALCTTVQESCWGTTEGPASSFRGTGHTTCKECLGELCFSDAEGETKATWRQSNYDLYLPRGTHSSQC